MVDVRGAVVKPGLYSLPKGSRAQDALAAAGGMTADANVDRVNLAKLLTDGDQVLVPTRTAQAFTTPAVASGTSVAAGPTSTPGKININTATVEDLDKLPGIGPALAQRIVDYRKAYGPFKKIDDLKNVTGIGDKLFEQIKNLITV
jgi:competence protein ComEA